MQHAKSDELVPRAISKWAPPQRKQQSQSEESVAQTHVGNYIRKCCGHQEKWKLKMRKPSSKYRYLSFSFCLVEMSKVLCIWYEKWTRGIRSTAPAMQHDDQAPSPKMVTILQNERFEELSPKKRKIWAQAPPEVQNIGQPGPWTRMECHGHSQPINRTSKTLLPGRRPG